MKKVIDGRQYDTEKAARVASAGIMNRGDPRHVSETLYLKRTGAYFLHGKGGFLSRYAQPKDGSAWEDGERIMPLSYEEAREWAQKNMDPARYEKYFGPVKKDAGKPRKLQKGILLTRETIDKLVREAQVRGMTISAVAEEKLSK
jgi:hypothetical protein